MSGDGSRLYGGRCNPRGIPAIYSSQNIALAVLEVLVHLEKSELPEDYVVMALRFDDHLVAPFDANPLELGVLSPPDFRALVYGSAAVIRVSSVVVGREHNYVLLPEAPGFAASIEWIEPFRFDDRLFPPPFPFPPPS